MKKITTLITLLVFTSVFSQLPSYVPSNGLIGYWPFNGNANDFSGNSLNGTVYGATLTTDRFGVVNSSYEFNLNYIKVDYSTLLNFSNNLTINVWYKISDSMGQISINPVFVSKHIAGSLNSSFVVYNENLCGPTIYQTDINNVVNYISNSNFCDISNWHMLTLTFNMPNLNMYLDGVLYSNIASNSINQTILPLVFGGTNNSSNENDIIGRMKGKLDDIGIWNRALTQEEITGLYNATNTNECQSLVINTGILSFNPVTYNNTVTIYPNPANDHITIDCGNLANVTGYQIKIVNTLGQEVFSGAMNTQQYVVPLNTWSGTGVYFVKIYDASNNLLNTKKIILQ